MAAPDEQGHVGGTMDYASARTMEMGMITPRFVYADSGEPVAHRYLYLDLPSTPGFQLHYKFWTNADGKPLPFTEGSEPPGDDAENFARVLCWDTEGLPVTYNLFYTDAEGLPPGIAVDECVPIEGSSVIEVPPQGLGVTEAHSRIVPGAEGFRVTYDLVDLGLPFTRVKAEVYAADDEETVVHTLQGLPADRGGNAWTSWRGELGEEDWLTIEDAPYTLKLIPGHGDEWCEEMGDEIEVDLELAEIHVACSGSNWDERGRVYGQRDPEGNVTTEADLEATAVCLFKDGEGRLVPGVPGVDMEWAFEDPEWTGDELRERIPDAKARDYWIKARDHQKDATDPPGDNCHADLGGARGDGSHDYFATPEGFEVSSEKTEATGPVAVEGTWTYTVIGRAETLEQIAGRFRIPMDRVRALNGALADRPRLSHGTDVTMPKLGCHQVRFVTSSVAGDTYELVAKLPDEAREQLDDPAKGGAKTDRIEVWRAVPFEKNLRMSREDAEANAGEASLPDFYDAAFTWFNIPRSEAIPVEFVWPRDPDYPEKKREDEPADPASDDPWRNKVRDESYAAEEEWLDDLPGGDGYRMVAAGLLRSKPWPNLVTVQENGEEVRKNTGGYWGRAEMGGAQGDSIVIYAASDGDASETCVHEAGHLLGLNHAPPVPDGEPSEPTEHDPDDMPPGDDPDADVDGGCLMRGDGGASDHLCGKCLLKIMGWDITSPILD